MTQQHPITPPPELVEQWMQNHVTKYDLARHAAHWGADRELEACCKWLEQKRFAFVDELCTARRPKPPTLKEQALIVLGDASLDAAHENILRRALEQLPED